MVGGNLPYQPDRGHFVWLDFTPQARIEQAGRRPALVISERIFNIGTGLVVACPITNTQKGGPFEVPLPAGMHPTGVILVEHVRSLDWMRRNIAYIGRASSHTVEEVVHRLAPVIGIRPA